MSYSRPPFVTLQSIAAKAGKMSTRFLLYFSLSMSQCQTVNIHNVKMPQCHNIHNVTIFPISQCHTSQYINITRSKYFTMSQCHNVTLFTISRCHNEQSTHLAPHSAMTKPAAKVTSRCNTVETGDLFASLGCMGKM